MTIPEAIELVLQSSSIAKGGEIFLIDMGESIKIFELAKQLISLSGYKVKDKNNEGDIEIIYTGLRPGEKLYEELLIDDKSIPSGNKNIYYAKEQYLEYKELIHMTTDLKNSINQFDLSSTIKILEKHVSGFKYSS